MGDVGAERSTDADDVLAAMGQAELARLAYEKALVLAKTIEPEFQIRSIPSIEQKLESVPKVR